MSVDVLISAAGSAVGLFLAGLVATAPRGQIPGARWLAAVVMCFALLSLADCLESSRLVLSAPHWGHIFDPLIFLLGPLIFGYVRNLTGRRRQTWLVMALHALPFVLVTALLMPFYLQDAAAKRRVLETELAAVPASDPTLAIAAAFALGYFIAGIWVLSRYRRDLPGNYSSLEQRTYRWLGTLLWALSALWLIWVIAILGGGNWSRWLDRVALPIAIYLLGWFGLRQKLLRFDHLPATVPAAPVAPATRVADLPDAARSDVASKYQRSGLTAERALQYQLQLEALMTLEKPHLENDLTLAQLASRVGISTHHLSQLFNEQMGVSFFDYINARRVEDVKRCLSDRAFDSEPLLQIALQAGFNSKTAFNAAFRKHVGTTPSAYRAQMSARR